jgi:hypothetical protein
MFNLNHIDNNQNLEKLNSSYTKDSIKYNPIKGFFSFQAIAFSVFLLALFLGLLHYSNFSQNFRKIPINIAISSMFDEYSSGVSKLGDLGNGNSHNQRGQISGSTSEKNSINSPNKMFTIDEKDINGLFANNSQNENIERGIVNSLNSNLDERAFGLVGTPDGKSDGNSAIGDDDFALGEAINFDVKPSVDLKVLESNIKYPKSARKYGIEDKFRAYILIDANGSILKIICKGAKYKILIAAAVDGIKATQFKPGIYKGKYVKSWLKVPVTFVLD